MSSIEKGAILLSIILLIGALMMPAFAVDQPGAEPEEMDGVFLFFMVELFPCFKYLNWNKI